MGVRRFLADLWHRPLLLAAIAAILAAHIFTVVFLDAGQLRSFLSNSLQVAASLLAFICAVNAFRRATGVARLFWAMVSVSFLVWSIAQAGWVYYFTWGGGVIPRVSLSNVLFRYYTAPLLLMMVVDGRKKEEGGAGWVRLLDVVQLSLVIFLVYLDMDFASNLHLKLETWKIPEAFFGINMINGAVAVAALARSYSSPSPVLSHLWKRISIYLGVYAGLAGTANHFAGAWNPAPATAWDVLYTIPLLLASALAADWQDEHETQPPLMRAVVVKTSRLNLAFFALLPLLVFVLALLVAPDYRWIAWTAVAVSLALYGLRLVATQIRQETSFGALRLSEERYRTLFENNLAGVFRVSRDGTLLDCNEAYARLYGFTRDEILRERQWRPWPSAEAREERLRRLEQGPLTNTETEMRRKDGSPIWVLENVDLRTTAEGEDVIEGTVLDLTDRRALEQQLFQAQKMEAIGRLAGGVAHDFNNLLSVILGYSDMLIESLADDKPRRARAEGVRGAGERAAALTRQLLAFSRQQVLEPRVLDLRRSVLEMQALLRRLIGENIELKFVPHLEAALVKADPSQIEQVVMNLAVNARDAMPTGGKLTIEIDAVQIDAARAKQFGGIHAGNYVQLTLSDTGQGMSPETIARIFEPFFTTKEKGKGTGLGLATVFGIVKQSGGHVAAASDPGKGSVFTVYLPQVDETPAKEVATKKRAPTGGNETILVVEDETSLRELITEFLVFGGYAVRAARNAEEALEWLSANGDPLHLLVTDVVLPGKSGRDLAESLKRERPAVKVIYVSGYTGDAIADHGVLDSGLSFLQKPFTREELLSKVRDTLDGASPGQA